MPILTPEERVGTTLAGKYRLDRILATGGMATVFAGTHAWTERAVAVKILNYEHARDPEVVQRFLLEARTSAQLKHPHVVDVLDMGQDEDGTVFLVLELLEGETLKARLKRGALTFAELGPLLAPVLRAVASAHAKGVIHRDLKPDNVFLSIGAHGETIPKLLDFGIAKVASGEVSTTRTGAMVGTPQFMAPEQVRGEREVGPPADVWSMGVLLHYALTKQMPFNAESQAAVLARVLTERARPIRAVDPNVPEALAAVVDRALQHEAAHRFADMREMAAAFEAALGLASPAPSASSAQPSIPPSAQPAAMAPTLPSEYPPAPTTPYAWGAPPPPLEEPHPRDRRPLLAAAAAALVLLSIASAFTVFVLTSPSDGETSSAPRGLVRVPTAASSPVPGAPSPRTTTPDEPSRAGSVAAPPIPPTVALEPSAQPSTTTGSSTEGDPREASTAAREAPAAAREGSTAAREGSTAAREAPTAAREAPTAAREAPTAAREAPTAAREAPPASTEGARTQDANTDEDDQTEGRPRRGTGGALILRDEGGRESTSGPRRGTGGALILR
ncbi:MAG: protein kinase [Sandaracinaceae bacterium]|nr:protein kinase [Sandaracinaceae bacterium]